MRTLLKATLGLFAILLFSCGGNEADWSDDPNTLVVWAIDPQSSGSVSAEYFKALAENFRKQNQDLKLLWANQKETLAAFYDKAKFALTMNKAPDILQISGGPSLGLFADSDRILDLTSELSNVQACQAAKEVMVWNDKTYGVAPFFTIAGLFVNEGKFKELGLKVPRTIGELESTAGALKAKGVQPFAVDAADKRPLTYLFMYLVNRLGGDAFQQTLNRKMRFDAPIYVQAAEKMKEWAQKGYFGPLPLAGAGGTAQKLMRDGKAGLHVSGSWDCAAYADLDQTIGFYAFPINPAAKGNAQDILGMCEVAFAAMQKSEGKKDMIMKFINAAMSPETIKAGSGMVPSVLGVSASEKLLDMAMKEFTKAKTIQFYWDKVLPVNTTASLEGWILTFLSADTDIKAACTKFERTAQNDMGSVVE